MTANNAAGSSSGPVWSLHTARSWPGFRLNGNQLQSSGFDAVVDTARDRIYVSIPALAQVHVLSMARLATAAQIPVRGSPLGLELSRDGRHLFVAQDGGTVGVVDLETRAVAEIDVGSALGGSRTYDVAQAPDGRLYVSASSLGSPTYLAEVRPDAGNAVRRIQSAPITGSRPVLAISRDGRFLYSAGRSLPEALYKLDLEGPQGPFAIPDFPRSPGSTSDAWDTSDLDVSPDGTQLYLPSGHVLNTQTLMPVGSIPAGNHEFGSRTSRVYSMSESVGYTWIRSFETRNFEQIANDGDALRISNARRLTVVPGDRGWLALSEGYPASRIDALLDDVDRDGVVNHLDNCARDQNADQADLDGDLVGDACDICPAVSDPHQRDADGDGRGDLCDPFPLGVLGIRPVLRRFTLTGESVPATYRLEDVRTGGLISQLEGVRATLTLGGNARFSEAATQGRLLSGGGTNRAYVEFVAGEVSLEILDLTAEWITLDVEDSDGIGISGIPTEIHETFETSSGGFTPSGIDNAWQLGVSSPFFGPRTSVSRAWTTTLVEKRTYQPGGLLVSPPYRLAGSGVPRVLIRTWLGTQSGQIEVTRDGGATWDVLETLAPLYGGINLVNAALDAYRGNTIQIGFRSLPPTGPIYNGGGWYIDDFTLSGVASTLDVLTPDGDADGDAVANREELARHTNPRDPDSDSDGTVDGLDNCALLENAD